MKKIFLCGLTHSGKGRLRPLLDGHEDISTGPFQNLGFGIINGQLENFVNKLKIRKNAIIHRTISKQNTKNLFNIIINDQTYELSVADFIIFLHSSSSGMNEIIEYSYAGKIRASSNAENQIFVDFKFSYYNFIEELKNKILLEKNLDQNKIYEIFIEVFLRNWKNINNKFDKKKFITIPSPNRLKTIVNIIKNIKDPKIIVVKRSFIGRCYSNAIHCHNMNLKKGEIFEKNSLFSNNLFTKFDLYMYSLTFIEEMIEFNCYVDNLQKKMPNKILTIEFENLFENLEESMIHITNFLGINNHKILYTPTLNSIDLLQNNTNFNTMNDNPEEKLSELQSSFINFLSGNKLSKMNFFLKIQFYLLYFKLIISKNLYQIKKWIIK